MSSAELTEWAAFHQFEDAQRKQQQAVPMKGL